MTVKLRAARPDDRQPVLNLLRAEGLPTDGVPEGMDGYVVAEAEGTFLGVAGLEYHGPFALLRSVAVRKPHRGNGIGAQLITDRIAQTKRPGTRSVYLLTTTAADYFLRRGFAVVNRDRVPEQIRQCQEYQESCPASASVMQLDLADQGQSRE